MGDEGEYLGKYLLPRVSEEIAERNHKLPWAREEREGNPKCNNYTHTMAEYPPNGEEVTLVKITHSN